MLLHYAHAVNSFAIISGYVGYGHRFNYSKLISIWFQVLFYGLGLSLIFYFLMPGSVGLNQILTNCFPVLFCKNWYFTAYFCISFFIPIFNYLLDKLSFRQVSILIIVSLALFSVLQNLPINRLFHGDAFFTNNRHSPIWLAVLYIIGAFIKKYKHSYRKDSFYLLMYAITCLFTFLYQYVVAAVFYYSFGMKMEMDNITYYESPTVLLSAVFLVLFFSNLKLNEISIKVISFFAPAQFGVLLIHANGNLSFVYTDYLNFIGKQNTILLILFLFITAILIWLICSLADKIRICLFNIIQLNKLCILIERILKKVLNKTLILMKTYIN